MGAGEAGGQSGGNPKNASSSGTASSPSDALSSFLNAAAGEFKKAAPSPDPLVSVAFALGWQMAEVYRPDRRGGSTPADPEDLRGISRLTEAELREMGLFQVQAGVTKLKPSIDKAGLEVPDAQKFAQQLAEAAGKTEQDEAIQEFHVKLLSTLNAADFRLGKAYGLGRALADTTRRPSEYQKELSEYRVATLTGWIRQLASALPAHAAHPVADSLEAWSRWVELKKDDQQTTRQLAAQGRLWRSFLSGEKSAVDALETGDYVKAGEGMLQRSAALAWRFLAHYWLLVIAVIVLFGGGVGLIVASGSGAAVAAGAATIFTSLGVTWKGIGSSLGTAAGQLEEPIWQSEIDRVIFQRITPETILKAAPEKRGPDEPSLKVVAPPVQRATVS